MSALPFLLVDDEGTLHDFFCQAIKSLRPGLGENGLRMSAYLEAVETWGNQRAGFKGDARERTEAILMRLREVEQQHDLRRHDEPDLDPIASALVAVVAIIGRRRGYTMSQTKRFVLNTLGFTRRERALYSYLRLMRDIDLTELGEGCSA